MQRKALAVHGRVGGEDNINTLLQGRTERGSPRHSSSSGGEYINRVLGMHKIYSFGNKTNNNVMRLFILQL